EGIQSRTSPLKLIEPAPPPEIVQRIIEAGVRAPDHGRLRPWRFVILEGDARKQLGDAMAELLRAKMPDVSQDQLEGERRKPLRAPMIIAVAAHVTPGKIPEIEQVLAVGAAVQNMMLAAHALGFGAMWKTGGAAYAANVKRLLELDERDHIVAFLYVGTVGAVGPLIAAPIDQVVRRL
ncbi:MAG: nitroreductase, partial [Povalibacter sp.]